MRDALLQFRDEIAVGDLLVKEIVEQLHLWVIDRFHDLERLSYGSQIIFRVFLRIDSFQQQTHSFTVDRLALDDRCGGLQGIDATLVLRLARHPRNSVAREQNHTWAINPLHYGQGLAQFPKQSFPVSGIADSMFQSSRAIKSDAEFLALGIGAAEIFVRPLVVFAD